MQTSHQRSALSKVLVFVPFFFSLFITAFGEPGSGRDTAYVKRVIDGDTVLLLMSGGEERARLIGVDTPEKNHPVKPIQYFSREATEYLRQLCSGRKVFIEYGQERRDTYGRLLVYLFLNDGRLINAEIIKNGYGFAYTRYPFKYQESFKQYEAEAREQGKGLWRNDGIDELKWLISSGTKPFRLYQMAGGKWAIEYEGYVRLRLSERELLGELKNLRIWMREEKGDGLKEILAENGWMKVEE